jgi:hypothetical protein
MPNFIDITSRRFGKLVVLKRDKTNGRRIRWLCRCDCGKMTVVVGEKLRDGHTRSCGCLRINSIKNLPSTFRHGMEGTRTYSSWSSMFARCYSTKSKNYVNYGLRGIVVCERWRDFCNFFADMGERPLGTSLDRVDNNGNYEPSNCRWANQKEQANNKRKRSIIDIPNFLMHRTPPCLRTPDERARS